MFDAVRNNKRLVQLFLVLIALPFAFFGVDSYVKNSGVGVDMASVGDTKISVQEFEQALRTQQEQARRSLGEQFRPEMMESVEVRQNILNSLIDRRLLLLELAQNRLSVPNDAFVQAVRNDPIFQENGQPSEERMKYVLQVQGLSEAQFEAQYRQQMLLGQFVGALTNTGFASQTQTDALLRLQTEERQYGEFKVDAASFADKVVLDPAAVQKYYDDNKASFEMPQKVRAEYIVFTPDAFLPQINVTDAAIKAVYEKNKDRYDQSERRASHILIQNGADKEKSKAKAEEVLKEVLASPGKFAELAKKYSEDPGSADKGGDLGFFQRGMMVKPFAEAVFSLKENDVSSVVTTDFGFHIIKLTGIKTPKLRPLEDVRAEIAGELKQEAAMKKFAEEADAFRDSVSQLYEALQPTADKFKLKLAKTDWLPKNLDPQAKAALGLIGNEKVFAALFADEALSKKQNIDVLEVSQNAWVAARVIESVPAETRAFEQVKAEIETRLRAQEMRALAKKSGEETLAKLQGNDDKLAWSAAQSVSRITARKLPAETIKSLFKADVQKLPAYIGVETAGGYSLYKILSVKIPEALEEAQRKSLRQEYQGILAQEDWDAYLAALRTRYKVKVNTAMLEAKEKGVE